MKINDLIVFLIFAGLFLPFILSDTLYLAYIALNTKYGILSSFVKFGILATLGELIGLRIKTGYYTKPGFGIFPKAVIWGTLGITIKLAFIIFTTGSISILQSFGYTNAGSVFSGNIMPEKIAIAFLISTLMNLIYAPMLMTMHKITDVHIETYKGAVISLVKPVAMGKILASINWQVQWDFVFKRTIPLFWIPAHTITFLLPPDFQVLFAALLGIILGIIMAIASIKTKK